MKSLALKVYFILVWSPRVTGKVGYFGPGICQAFTRCNGNKNGNLFHTKKIQVTFNVRLFT